MIILVLLNRCGWCKRLSSMIRVVLRPRLPNPYIVARTLRAPPPAAFYDRLNFFFAPLDPPHPPRITPPDPSSKNQCPVDMMELPQTGASLLPADWSLRRPLDAAYVPPSVCLPSVCKRWSLAVACVFWGGYFGGRRGALLGRSRGMSEGALCPGWEECTCAYFHPVFVWKACRQRWKNACRSVGRSVGRSGDRYVRSPRAPRDQCETGM